MPLPFTYNSAQVFTAHASDPKVFDGILIGGTGGNITVTPQQGLSIQFTGVLAGSTLPIRTRLVTAATATQLVGLKGPNPPVYFNSAQAVTKSDTVANVFDALYISATGDGALNIVAQGSSGTIALTGLSVGRIVPIRTRLVLTGGTATAIGLRF